MTTNPPNETPHQRRLRLLAATRRAETAINESLSEHSESEQDARRRKINEESERQFPGVTEDEQTVTGMYEPHIRNFPLDLEVERPEKYRATHEPMRRRLRYNTGTTLEGDNLDPTLGGEVPIWSDEEEREFRIKETAAENALAMGTGEWAMSLTPDQVEEISGYKPYDYSLIGMTDQEVEAAEDRGEEPVSNQGYWFRGETHNLYEVPVEHNVDDSRGSRIHPFNAHGENDGINNVTAPHAIDIENVKKWAGDHLKEKQLTNDDNTEGARRYNQLLEDVNNTVAPIYKDLDNYRINNTIQRHKQALQRIWNTHVNPPQVSLERPPSTRPRRRNVVTDESTQRARGRRNVVNAREVARRFVLSDTGVTPRRNLRSEEATGYVPLGRLTEAEQRILNENQNTHVLYSYNTPIAWRRHTGEIVMPHRTFSKTTARQQRELRTALGQHSYESPEEIADRRLRQEYLNQTGRRVGYRHYQVPRIVNRYYPTDTPEVRQQNALDADEYVTNRLAEINRMREQRAARSQQRRGRPTAERLRDAGQQQLDL